MKKIKFKFNLKKFNRHQGESDWQHSVFFVLVFAVLLYIGILLFIIVRPVPADVKSQVDNEITSTQIKLDIKTLEKIKNKDY